MHVKIKKLTDIDLLRRACDMTRHSDQSASAVSLAAMYRCEHSPIRTQLFWIEMLQIPTFVSVHFVRHNVGVTHFVESNRNENGVIDRNTPVNHAMLLNAQALINIARKRLCKKTHHITRAVMLEIKLALTDVDRDLAGNLVSDCVYRGACFELKGCKDDLPEQ